MKLLLVEDSKLWASLLEKYCQQIGAETEVVETAQRAIDELDQGQYDGLILDLLLAGETGLTLLNEIISYEDLAQLPIVVWTSVDTVGGDDLKRLGVSAVVNKTTASPDEIRRTLIGVFG